VSSQLQSAVVCCVPLNLTDPDGHRPICDNGECPSAVIYAWQHPDDPYAGYIARVLDPTTTSPRYAGKKAWTQSYHVTPNPKLGLVRSCLFISESGPGLGPSWAQSSGEGDSRGFNSHFGIDSCRAIIAIDYTSGMVAVRQNPSCAGYGRDCTTPGSPPGFAIKEKTYEDSGQQVTDTQITLNFRNPRSLAHVIPAPRISGTLDLLDVGDGRIHVAGQTDSYPALEIYEDQDCLTTTHAQYPETNIAHLVGYGQRTVIDQFDASRVALPLSGPWYELPGYAWFPTLLAEHADANMQANEV
jgi:hypothetical protein